VLHQSLRFGLPYWITALNYRDRCPRRGASALR
jgi:hypothetical protein